MPSSPTLLLSLVVASAAAARCDEHRPSAKLAAETATAPAADAIIIEIRCKDVFSPGSHLMLTSGPARLREALKDVPAGASLRVEVYFARMRRDERRTLALSQERADLVAAELRSPAAGGRTVREAVGRGTDPGRADPAANRIVITVLPAE